MISFTQDQDIFNWRRHSIAEWIGQEVIF